MSSEAEVPAPQPDGSPSSGNLLPRWAIWVALIFILGCAAFVRLRLLDFPLERDEGEYAYTGQLMLQGIPPYKLAYNMKLPGTYAAYAVIMAAFGETTRGIHLGLILVNSITILLVYFLGWRLFGPICGLVAAASFALLSLSYSALGLAAHATHFVTLFGIGGALLLWYALEQERRQLFFWSGILFGLAFLMKQQGIFFGVFGAVMLLWNEWQQRPRELRRSLPRCTALFAGMLLPFVVACATLVGAGVFPSFWFWTFSYARQYAAITPLSHGWKNFKLGLSLLFQAAPLIWIIAGLGFALLPHGGRNRRKVIFAVALLTASFAMACPGLYFREHYFIPLLPAVAILTGAAIQTAFDEIRRRAWAKAWLIIPLLAFLTASADTVFRHRALFFRLGPSAAARLVYRENPFPEAPEIARYIREHSAPDSRIAVLGSEPEIYFYSNRHSATGFIYTYPLMEPHKYALIMQQEMITQMETARPEYFVQVNIPFSWLPRPTSYQLILEWFASYAPEHLEQVGFVDILSRTNTEYHLGDWEGKYLQPRGRFSVTIFKRKTNS